MSGGGGGGIIIIRRLAEGRPVSDEDQAALHAIADKASTTGIKLPLLQSFRVIRILWKYLRS